MIFDPIMSLINGLRTKVGNATLTTTAQDLSGGVNELNDQIVALQNGKINRISSFTRKNLTDVFTAFNNVIIITGNYWINEDLKFVTIWIAIKIPPLTHDTKILELSSNEPTPKYLASAVGNDGGGGGVNNIYINNNSRDICIGATQSNTLNNFIVQLSYFY